MNNFLWFFIGVIVSGFVRPVTLLAIGYAAGYESQLMFLQFFH
jgi:hypothetical protein